MHIFLVENHPDTLKWLTLYLEDLEHTVTTARSLHEALELLPASDSDVLISDIGLPDGDGWELMRKVQLPHPVFAIAMSGFGMNADRAKSKAAGFRHHLLKPFHPDELDAVLDEAAAELAVK